ncbi:Gfo/Idh/MocA family protein [Deinococcus malanensis]|uniref:Gfo/Idh/MocA family protein n=1 Tax=Deinococcus malanensis TaxID=1706855 RepID=UPI003638EC9F
MNPVNIAIVGCGVIATPYAKDMLAYGSLRLHGCFDLDPARAQAYAAEQDCRVYDSLDTLLADPEVEVVVNLTVLPAHYEVSRQALEAGKHVFSEKPLAGSSAQAQELVALARERNVRLSCAPVTFLGEAQQRAMKELLSGRIGPVRVIYAEANHGRIETWHPVPHSFYQVGRCATWVYIRSVWSPASLARRRAYGPTAAP